MTRTIDGQRLGISTAEQTLLERGLATRFNTQDLVEATKVHDGGAKSGDRSNGYLNRDELDLGAQDLQDRLSTGDAPKSSTARQFAYRYARRALTEVRQEFLGQRRGAKVTDEDLISHAGRKKNKGSYLAKKDLQNAAKYLGSAFMDLHDFLRGVFSPQTTPNDTPAPVSEETRVYRLSARDPFPEGHISSEYIQNYLRKAPENFVSSESERIDLHSALVVLSEYPPKNVGAWDRVKIDGDEVSFRHQSSGQILKIEGGGGTFGVVTYAGQEASFRRGYGENAESLRFFYDAPNGPVFPLLDLIASMQGLPAPRDFQAEFKQKKIEVVGEYLKRSNAVETYSELVKLNQEQGELVWGDADHYISAGPGLSIKTWSDEQSKDVKKSLLSESKDYLRIYNAAGGIHYVFELSALTDGEIKGESFDSDGTPIAPFHFDREGAPQGKFDVGILLSRIIFELDFWPGYIAQSKEELSSQ